MAGPQISGGGTIRVDTAEMLHAAGVLADAAAALSRVSALAIDAAASARSDRRARILHAHDLLARAQRQIDLTADGLTTAAQRYGWAEHTAADVIRTAGAVEAALRGTLLRVTLGPLGLQVLLTQEAARLAAVVVVRTLWQGLTTGRVEPQLDPVVLQTIALSLSSVDDGVRGYLLLERPEHLVRDDPKALFGTEAIAAGLAAILLRHAGTPMTVTAGPERRVQPPRSLAALVGRLPDGSEPAGQVRIERYDGAGGRRWIVYSAGTVAFNPAPVSPEARDEPFDLASNLQGVGDRPSDSQRAVLAAMEQAGVGRDEPVLFVGHSQGALNAVRVAEDGGYRVGGVVQFGGPTQQIALPESVPVLSVEHEEDLVPVLGGLAAGGAAGLNRVVVRRSLPGRGRAKGLGDWFPSHETAHYRETMRQAEANGGPQITRFREQIAPFLGGEAGTATRYKARRIAPETHRHAPNQRLPAAR